MITAREVHAAEFRRASAGRAGYDEVAVDDFLDRVIETLVAIEGDGAMPHTPVTSAEVVDIEFPERHIEVDGGYDLDDVDDLLDEVAKRLFAYEQSVGVDVPLSDASSSDDVARPEGYDQAGRADDAVRSERFVDDTPAAPELSDDDFTRESDRDSRGVDDASALAAAAGAPVPDRPETKNVPAPSVETITSETPVPDATNSDAVSSDAEAHGVRIVAVGPVVEESRGDLVADDMAADRVVEPTEARSSDHGDHADQGTRSQGWFSDGPVGPVGEASDKADDLRSDAETESGHGFVHEDAADVGSNAKADVGAGSERHGDASSAPAVGSSQDAPRINMVGGDPLPETSDDRSEAEQAASEPVHPVGSDPDDAHDDHGHESARRHHEATGVPAERDAAMSPQGPRDVNGDDVPTAAPVGDDVTGRDLAFADASVPDAGLDSADSVDATARPTEDEAALRPSADGTEAGSVGETVSANDPATAPEQPAPTSAASVVINDPEVTPRRTMGESWGDGIGAEQPLPGVAELTEVEGEQAVPPRAVGTSEADGTPSTGQVENHAEHPVTQSDWAPSEVNHGGPQFVSYPATDHRVPLPRTEIRRHMSDADREAEAQYHPEFSSYATPEVEMTLPEPALPDLGVEQLDTAQPAELQAESQPAASDPAQAQGRPAGRAADALTPVTTPEEPGYASVGAPSDADDVAFEFDGDATDIPASNLIDRDAAFAAVAEFLATEARPTSVAWQEF